MYDFKLHTGVNGVVNIPAPWILWEWMVDFMAIFSLVIVKMVKDNGDAEGDNEGDGDGVGDGVGG